MKYITKSLDWKIVLEHIASIFQSSHMLCNFQSKDNIYPLLNNSLYSNSYSSLDLLLHTFYSQGDKVYTTYDHDGDKKAYVKVNGWSPDREADIVVID